MGGTCNVKLVARLSLEPLPAKLADKLLYVLFRVLPLDVVCQLFDHQPAQMTF